MTWNVTESPPGTVWRELVGKRVSITWRHPENQWESWSYYRVDAADQHWVLLQGLDVEALGQVSRYEGGPIAVPLQDIEMAEVVDVDGEK